MLRKGDRTMEWHVECKFSGVGQTLEGTMDDAIRVAVEHCASDYSRYVLWLLPGNIRLAEVTHRGCGWTKSRLDAGEVKSLMRRHRVTIASLAQRLDVTQRRIRQVRREGVHGPYVVRDWIEAIAGKDIGPLPQRCFIRRGDEPRSCSHCARPLAVGRFAFTYVGDVFCTVTCCRKSRSWPS